MKQTRNFAVLSKLHSFALTKSLESSDSCFRSNMAVGIFWAVQSRAKSCRHKFVLLCFTACKTTFPNSRVRNNVRIITSDLTESLLQDLFISNWCFNIFFEFTSELSKSNNSCFLPSYTIHVLKTKVSLTSY